MQLHFIIDGEPEEVKNFFGLDNDCDDCEVDDEAEELSEDEQKKINLICDVAGAAAGAVTNALRKYFD